MKENLYKTIRQEHFEKLILYKLSKWKYVLPEYFIKRK